MRALFALPFTLFMGCLQLTGVADYKVEEGPPPCTPPPGSPCRVGPNCGCGDGETCALAAVDGTGKCEPAGSIERGGACTGSAECAKGMLCFIGFCQPYCGTDKDCGASHCEGFSIGKPPQDVQNVGVCLQPCDQANDTCSGGMTCQQTSATRFSCLAP